MLGQPVKLLPENVTDISLVTNW